MGKGQSPSTSTDGCTRIGAKRINQFLPRVTGGKHWNPQSPYHNYCVHFTWGYAAIG